MKLYLWTRRLARNGQTTWNYGVSRSRSADIRRIERDYGYSTGPLTVVTLKAPKKARKGKK